MKTSQQISLLFALVTLLASCQTGTDANKILSNQDAKIKIMNTIATDSLLSSEMIGAMMNSKNGNRMMMQNQEAMLKIMQNNPAMMQSMMTGMMETYKNDTLMMSSMSSILMTNPQMKDQIYRNRNGNRDTKHMNNKNESNYKTK